jgi:PTS system fructose-specific IIC component
MLPFVVAGGLLIALAFALGGIHANDDAAGHAGPCPVHHRGQGRLCADGPGAGGYIAYSIADRPGIAPGMIGGMLRQRWARVFSAVSWRASSRVTASTR